MAFINNDHFEEHFQESESNVSQNVDYRNQQNVNFNDDEGYALQLIKVRPGGKIQLDQQGLDIIASCDKPVGFVSLVGKYRTGKSFLLNKLLRLQNRGFRVDPSTNACTEGIWMWSRPIQNNQHYIFFLDTQGIDSLSKNVNHDSKIFVIACLISSYFIYNTVGTIDQKSISQLNMVTTLSKKIIIQDKLSPKQNEEYLYRYMPRFLWLIRDFTLQLKDQRGKISANQYLERALMDENSLIKANEDVRKVRRSMTTYFKERQCMTLVRPAKEESDLQRLDTLPLHALRKQFIDGLNNLMDKILKHAGPKMHDGDPLYGSSIVSMIQSYTDSINRQSIPNIKTAWEHIGDNQGAYAFNRAIEEYTKMIDQDFGDDNPKDDLLLPQILNKLRQSTIHQFQANLTQPNDAYLSKLKEFLNKKQKQITEINIQLNKNRNAQILIDCSTKFIQNLQNKVYLNNEVQFTRDLSKVQNDYNSKAKGSTKAELISIFLNKVYPTYYNEKNSIKPLKDNSINEQQSKQIQILRQKNESLQNQLKSIKYPIDNGTIGKVGEKNGSKPGKSDIKAVQGRSSKQIEKTGCCGTSSSCIIM